MAPIKKTKSKSKSKSKSMKGGNAHDLIKMGSPNAVAPAAAAAAAAAAGPPPQMGGKRSKKSKTKKSPMPAGMAYCIRCHTRVKVETSKTEDRKMKNGKTRKFLIMQGKCGHEIMNFTK